MTSPRLQRIVHVIKLIETHPWLFKQEKLGDITALIFRSDFRNGIHPRASPTCLAGFVLREFSSPGEIMNYRPQRHPADIFYRYAAELLGFKDVYANGFFKKGWPTPWMQTYFDFDMQAEHLQKYEEKYPRSSLYRYENRWFVPQAPEAVDVLRRFVLYHQHKETLRNATT